MTTVTMAGNKLSSNSHRFTRIGGYQIQKHIYSDDGLSEQIKQHNLKGAEKQEDEQNPEHLATVAGQSHQQIVTG